MSVLPRGLVLCSLAIAGLATAASLAGLVLHFPYAAETENWRLQAQGQDIGNLIAAVLLIAATLAAKRGSFKAYLLWLGTLFYFMYAYIIYAMAVHFSSLFLVYVAVLGLTFYTILFALARPHESVVSHAGQALAGYTLITMGALFGVLWLGEIIPATLSGQVPQSLQDAGLWANPVHVIDLSTVLPAFAITGYLVLKQKQAGLFYAAPWLLFAVLMGSSIVAATVLMAASGLPGAIQPMVMVSALVIISLMALVRFLRGMRSHSHQMN